MLRRSTAFPELTILRLLREIHELGCGGPATPYEPMG